MLRLLASVVLIVLAGLTASGTIERLTLYPFDPTRTEPAAGFVETMVATDDGETLVVWAAPPRRGKPTVLYFHGNAGNLAARTPRFEAFVARGFGLVAAGYRGSSGSTGTPSETALVADAEVLAQAVARLAGPGPVVYYGESLGTAVAIALAERRPPDALVLEAPFASLAALSADLYGTEAIARLADSEWPSAIRIGRVRSPLLVLHGSDDALVPLAQGRAVFEAAASGDKTFHVVAGAGHTDVWQIEAQRRLFAFLDRF